MGAHGPRAVQLLARLDRGIAVERLRQIEDERASEPHLARQPDLAAKQTGDLAANRKAQPRPTVLAAGGAVRLLERLEDDAVFVGGDADARVADTECHNAPRAVQRGV